MIHSNTREYQFDVKRRQASFILYVNTIILCMLAVQYSFLPFGILLVDLQDPGLRGDRMPAFVFRWHKALTPKLENWASERTGSADAEQLGLNDISGTEWPLFSAVYYLWSTEALQVAWENNPNFASSAPAEYASGAIEAAAELVADPRQADWVIRHWGSDYLTSENLFYRMLLISGLTSYQSLTGNSRFERILRDQIISLSSELDASPYGLLDDYPDQCYPIDILTALGVMKRGAAMLDIDLEGFLNRSRRGFENTRLDPATNLPAYFADSDSGLGLGPARGVGISMMLIWAPELWPDLANDWARLYEEQFWQEGYLISGYRELSNYGDWPIWYFDIDAGPVLNGYGTAASAFGIGAARANGLPAQAYTLGAEALVAAWPLPDGSLLGPRLLSNLSDAPYLGETALLFNFTRTPVSKADSGEESTALPRIVWIALGVYLIGGIISLVIAIKRLKSDTRGKQMNVFPDQLSFQFAIWMVLIVAGIWLTVIDRPGLAFILLLGAQLFPRKELLPRV